MYSLSGKSSNGQDGFKLVLFPKRDGTNPVGINVFGQRENSYRFLSRADGKWEDVSIEVVPEYSTGNIYDFRGAGKKHSCVCKTYH